MIVKFQEWNGFKDGAWQSEVNVRTFIQDNYTEYTGDDSFLVEPTEATEKLWAQLKVSGKMIIPLDESDGAQRMLRLTKKRDGSVKQEKFDAFSFVPMLEGKTQK